MSVGAGAGSYEPADAEVTAVDPSAVLLQQHPGDRKVEARAEQLPFADGTFDAAMAVLTVHHRTDPRRGPREPRRVARRRGVFTWDPEHLPRLWLVEALGAHTVLPFPVPHDFTDGLRTACRRRPEHFLDPVVRAAGPRLPAAGRRLTDGPARTRHVTRVKPVCGRG
ncbi:methyltransferase domain-containing protein [Streptantibioticus cattleyicolor]|uniref:Methyltransferase type 11 domain-containing protein n=1 Tax=Streptantibioticus cattleyicolor (strain ATCC 35852 / DSM 46488 / JCM 4925 / NBRC 14057 / NRRL 8057) TaxID=1003195 RepID=F8JJ76_STREN